MISVQIDNKGFIASLNRFRDKMQKSVKFSAMDIGHEILRLSMFEVPHDKGTLQNSGTVDEQGDDVVVGYHTPYAARLHEHPEYRFQKGRKGKYLEDPIKRNQHALGIKFGNSVKGEL